MTRRCPKCEKVWSYRLADGRFKCRSCGHRYTWSSAWAASRLSDSMKRQLLERFVLGVPAYRQRFRTPASLGAVERFYRIVRACCAHVEELRKPFRGALECDESSFGGSRRGPRGWGAKGKVIVFGMVKRNGLVKAFPLSGRAGKEAIRLVCEHTRPGSLYYTDDWHAYASLRLRGEHVVIRKEKGRPKGRDHINGIEGFWSYAKHWLYPYRGVPRKYFHLYLGEICYRFNHREEDLVPNLTKLLKSISIGEIDPILVRFG